MDFRQILMTAATQAGGSAAAAPVTTAWLNAASGVNLDLAGDVAPAGQAWGNSSNITVCDSNPVTSAAKTTGNTQTCRAFYDFSAEVPSGATIIGVEFRLLKLCTVVLVGTDLIISLVTANTNSLADRAGSNKASATPWDTSYTSSVYGGAADLWGATLTDTIVRSGAFGVDLRGNRTSGFLRMDCAEMRVTYSA